MDDTVACIPLGCRILQAATPESISVEKILANRSQLSFGRVWDFRIDFRVDFRILAWRV